MFPEKLRPYFNYTKSQRNGLAVLFLLIVALQLVYHFADFSAIEKPDPKKQRWLAVQSAIDSMGKVSRREKKPKIYPFNPNFITDFKGYKLGMSVQEIDRLLAFRNTDRYVNSAQEFQKVTGVSDSLLRQIAPYFKFPDWVQNRKTAHYPISQYEKPKLAVLDINTATQDDLKKIYGIGDGLSERILKEKEKLGGFVSMEQMQDIWGLSPEVIGRLRQSFKVEHPQQVRKININEASVKELAQFPYFRYALAKSIVTYRSMNGLLKSSEDLLKISGFPVDKMNIIALYLEF
ncbi:ComEA family DNA-binding protein [Flavobacterium sp.]|uniref:ComEA family DNA-binding protein n=1 Tax=Flavobacterium sp. TaxID=239 RepID=UPI0039E533D6